MTDTPRSSGIYGLFNLDGAPVAECDAAALGLDLVTQPQSWHATGYDAKFQNAISSHCSAMGFTLLVGEVEDTDALCAALGLQSSVSAAALAEAAMRLFGSDLPAKLIGEWSLLHRASNGQLTLMQSAARRDRVFYAVRGKKVAVAPNLFALARLGWVGNATDEAGLLFSLGRAQVRAGCGDSTMLKSVYLLEQATSAVIDPDGRVTKQSTDILLEQPQWQGSYADAVVETENMLRRILHTKLARHNKAAVMLSGGLDSSLLAWLCALECNADSQLLALTSVAPPDSGIADEAQFADLVAQTLGIKSRHVFPAYDVNIYRPPEAILTGGSGPILSNRHCLTNALQMAAQDAGASLMIDGTYGELNATARLPDTSPLRQLRTMAGRLLRSTPLFRSPVIKTTAFHARLAPHLLANLPDPIVTTLEAPAAISSWPPKNGLLGYMPGTAKALSLPNEFYPGAVRATHPYRDVRLLRLFAGFPLHMLVKGGADRGIARSMMAEHLPDTIRLRDRGMPASPDHLSRLQRQADAARQRIQHFRKAEIDDWLDLDWLDTTLARVVAHGPTDVGEANEVQLTAITAEFLLWWRSQS